MLDHAAIEAAVVEHAGELHLLRDRELAVTWVDEAVTTVLGFDPGEIPHAVALGLVHPDDAERDRRVLRELVGDPGGRRRQQYRVRHADGSWRWVEALSTNHLDTPGVVGILTTMRDVTSQVVAKRRLAVSDRRLRTIVSSAGDVVAILDADGTIEYVTPTVATLLGRPVSQVQAGARDLVHPDDVASLARALAAAVAEPGVAVGPLDARVAHSEGSWVTVEVLVTDYRADPIVRGVVLNARDVTARREAERGRRAGQLVFNALVELAPVGIFLADPTGDWTYVNARIVDEHGVTADDLLGDGWTRLLEPADVVRLRSELAAWDGRGRLLVDLAGAGPGHRQLRMTLTRPRSDDADLGMVGTLEDVTTRRELEEMLIGGAALGSVAGVVGSAAHDLHNYLDSIRLQLDLLGPDVGGERLEVVAEAVERASDLAEDLTAMSRPTRAPVQALDVGEAMARLAPLLEVLVEHRARLRFEDRAPGRRALGERSGIDRIVTNLVVNARDALETRGHIDVVVEEVVLDDHEAPPTGAPGTHLAVRVTDDGRGIPEAVAERVFEPHFTTKQDGNGIGLAASRRTVREWGGDLRVTSTGPSGTTMTLLLPVADG